MSYDRRLGWFLIVRTIDNLLFQGEAGTLIEIQVIERDHAITAVGAMVVFMRDMPLTVYTGDRWGKNRKTPREIVTTFTNQVSHDTSLLRVMEFEHPFAEAPLSFVRTSHLAVTTSPKYLEDAEWIGIYTLSFPLLRAARRRDLDFDPPMHDIRFKATQSSGDPHLSDLCAGGRDSVGSFTLDGIVNRESGFLELHKTYQGGSPTWRWQCLMTPFGMVGSWGDINYGGWVWLWKLPPS